MAMPPPKISPDATTTPIAEETSPTGADSVAIGPVMSAMFPRLKNVMTNSSANKAAGLGPVAIKT